MKKSLTVKAESDNLHEVTAFVEAMLTEKGCPEESHAVIHQHCLLRVQQGR